jgi:hypothetical protein
VAGRRRTGRSTLACLIFVAASTAACSAGGAGSSSTTVASVAVETTTTTEPPLEAGRQVFVYTPSVGECFDRRQLEERPATGPQQTDIVLLLDCALPHDNEIFTVLELPDAGPVYPGETAMQEFARRNCADAFAAYVGRAYETSELEIGHYLPSSNEWGSGARRLGCYLYAVDGEKLIGSMQGSGR